MTEKLWTRGPWKIVWNVGDGRHHVIARADAPTWPPIATVNAWAPEMLHDEEAVGKSNALLIAAAPGLAAAVGRFLNTPPDVPENEAALDALQEAYAACFPQRANAGGSHD